MSRGGGGRRGTDSPQSSPNRIGILISGRGSNMAAILDHIRDGCLDAVAAIVISNSPAAPGLETARERGVEILLVDDRESSSREAHDRRMAEALDARDVLLVCLAGYMRILSPWFVRHYGGRILNIHPSLLPAFPGRQAAKDALAHGVKVSGCTVHLVDEGVDTGPILAQAVVPVLDDDSVGSLSARILEQEHRLYSEAIGLFFKDPIRVVGRRTFVDSPRRSP